MKAFYCLNKELSLRIILLPILFIFRKNSLGQLLKPKLFFPGAS